MEVPFKAFLSSLETSYLAILDMKLVYSIQKLVILIILEWEEVVLLSFFALRYIYCTKVAQYCFCEWFKLKKPSGINSLT